MPTDCVHEGSGFRERITLDYRATDVTGIESGSGEQCLNGTQVFKQADCLACPLYCINKLIIDKQC